MKIIAFDQATKVTGYAIYNNGKLTTYGTLLANSDDSPFVRMHAMYIQILALLRKTKPDLVSIEGTQFQNNYHVYSELSQMQGVVFAACFTLDISFVVTKPSEWRSHCGVKGKKRAEQKASAIAIVQEMGIVESEDVCEAILHGRYIIENKKGK